jgi:hypothetical protein
MFKWLYFDTSALINAGWPQGSADLERLLKVATTAPGFEVAICLPEPVEVELEAHWLRDFMDKQDRAESKVNDFRRHLKGVVADEVKLVFPSIDKAQADYRACVQTFMAKWGIRVVPFTRRSVEEFFEMAAHRRLPIQDNDKGFRDAVIFLSIIDDLLREQPSWGVLVTKDEVFREQDVKRIATDAGVRLDIYQSPKDAVNEIIGYLENDVKLRWQKDQERALLALKRVFPQIRKFVCENLEVMEPDLALLFGTLRGLRNIEVVSIGDVRTPPPWPRDRQPSERVKVSFDLNIKIHVLVDRYILPPPRGFKVGEEYQELPHFGIGSLQVQEEVLESVVEVQATATLFEGEYRDVVLVSARFPSRTQSLDIFGLGKLLGLGKGQGILGQGRGSE